MALATNGKNNKSGNGIYKHVITAIITCCLTIIVMWFTVIDSVKTMAIENRANILKNQEVRERDWTEVKYRLDKIDDILVLIQDRLPPKR